MLTLTFLGVGSAFAKRNYNSNALIEAWSKGPAEQDEPDDNLLIDFGCTGPLALHALKDVPGYTYFNRDGVADYTKIRRIFITHQHADHIGGLEELAFKNLFAFANPETGKPFKPQIISSMSIMVNLWDTSLKGGMSPMPGRYALLQDYFFIHALKSTRDGHESFQMARRYRFDIFPTDHIQIDRKYDWPSFGLVVTDTHSGHSAVFSGDTRYDYDAYASKMEAAKFIFHDAQLVAQPTPVHALLDELRAMPPDIKSKTYLYHYSDNWDDPEFASVESEFAGFAAPHHRYTLFE